MRKGLQGFIWVAAVGSAIAACGGDGRSDRPDTLTIGPIADANLAECLSAEDRTEACTVDIRGSVIDFITQMRLDIDGTTTPIATLVRYNTAFDGPVPFPVNCVALGQFPAPAQTGAFNQPDRSCASPIHPPTLLLLVDDASTTNRVVPTAFTVELTCTGGDCGAVDVAIPVAQVSYATEWRQELDTEGMPSALSRGLAIVQYLEPGGGPAQGVTPTVVTETGERPLVSGTELRFFGTDRRTILAVAQTTTGPSGLAIVGLDGQTAEIGGTRGADVWPTVNVLWATGWYFVTSTTR